MEDIVRSLWRHRALICKMIEGLNSKNMKLTKRQQSIIVGKLLGDGHLETQTRGKTYRLKIEHSIKQKSYVDWLYNELQGWTTSQPKIKQNASKGKLYQKYWFNSVSSGSLRFYAQQFYPHGKKVVPKLIHHWLNPIAFAVWFMDDGSIKSKECSGKILNTQSFDHQSIERLQQALQNNFDLRTTMRKQKEGKQIYIPASEIKKLRNIISKYVIPSMQYKLG